MLSKKFALLAAALLSGSPLLASATGAVWTLKDSFVGEGFLSGFNFEAIADPTHGRVNYVDQATAQSLGLVTAEGDTFIMRSDNTTVLTASDLGRNSIRIRSNNLYTSHVAVFDIRHMPQGCGTWPAVWETLEDGWPAGGEIDIVEGVNDVVPNQSTLHTSPNCTMPTSGLKQTGTTALNNCDTNVNGNSGCGVQNNKPNNYGPGFNAAGGGWYALERTNSYIRVFFWGRNDKTVPASVSQGLPIVDTSLWGEPYALFPDTDCDLASHFSGNNIIINLTFCGDWAGSPSIYTGDGCPGVCSDYVDANPSAFTDAYWNFASARVYENPVSEVVDGVKSAVGAVESAIKKIL
ncbi:hypothetical protein M0805_000797 [Coniferiporia weirii]|nr:hypothetical protein M0805_000797 [Coniferiporia weirii]